MNIQIESGTNKFHGGGFEFLRNDKFDANDLFNNKFGRTKPAFRQNQFGGTQPALQYTDAPDPGRDKIQFLGENRHAAFEVQPTLQNATSGSNWRDYRCPG